MMDVKDKMISDEQNKESLSFPSENVEESVQSDFFTDLMFGRRQNTPKQEEQNVPKQDEVDFFVLMEQIDDIMASLKELKPLLKQFSPIIDYIKKKI